MNSTKADIQNVETYAKEVGMDEANKEGLAVLTTQGEQAFLKHAFTDKNADGTERTMDYAEMRARYG